ncbi:metallophosphoesterase [Candidatus Blastococcus massiliensis]|uniref:metallophosphoesterase n=1 Tax=Candidatus Blastococcus massiliensis TaxID=1470358 RepID=UPI0004B920F8|nr:metallophosphoesterase [Candidatus Blastococcus massiliensis]
MIALLVFGTVILLVMALLHGYLWLRLVRDTTRPGRARRGLTLLTAALALLPVAAILLRRSLPPDAAAPLDWVAFSWLGVAFYAFLALLALEPVRLMARIWRRVGPSGARRVPRRDDGPAPPDRRTAPGRGAVREDRDVSSTRRVFLARSLAVTAGAAALGTAGTGAYLAQAAPVVRRVPVTLRGLDPALEGLRIVTFSDAHLSSTFRGRRFERVVETVNAQRPDVVAIVGDLVDGDVDDLREEVAPLADLVSEHGVFFVTGNHEYFVDTRAWLRHLPSLGVQVLRNERVAIGRGGASFDLAGIDDRMAASSGVPGHGADLDAALDGRDDATPVVLLAHQPVMVEQARAAGVDLQLSGHTHGGQLWPFDYAVRLDQPAVQGWSRHGDTQLYVTPGVGHWGPPMRVGARPEVTVVELSGGPR